MLLLVIFYLTSSLKMDIIKSMKLKEGEYYSIAHLHTKTGKSLEAIKQWLFNHGIKPVSKDALYEGSVLTALMGAPSPGRPKKQPEKTTGKNKQK